MPIQSLRAITADGLERTEEILRACDPPPMDPQRVASLRKNAAIAYTRFFTEQERLLLRPLRESGDPTLLAIVRGCVERDLEGRILGLAHYRHWTLDQIARDPGGFGAAIRIFLDWMRERIRHNEETAYPALAKLISSAKQPAAR